MTSRVMLLNICNAALNHQELQDVGDSNLPPLYVYDQLGPDSSCYPRGANDPLIPVWSEFGILRCSVPQIPINVKHVCSSR